MQALLEPPSDGPGGGGVRAEALDVDGPREGSCRGLAAVHLAALGGHDETLALLEAHGADPNLAAGDGSTPLTLACEQVRKGRLPGGRSPLYPLRRSAAAKQRLDGSLAAAPNRATRAPWRCFSAWAAAPTSCQP